MEGTFLRYSAQKCMADQLLRGASIININGHSGMTADRQTDIRLVKAAANFGLKSVLFMNHLKPTTERAKFLQEFIGNKIKVLGGLVLNRETGGLNPVSVENELNSGAKCIWMPTISAENASEHWGEDKRQAISLTTDKGVVVPALCEILDLIAQYDAVLGTGYLGRYEVEKIVALAKTRGVNKILVNQPPGGALAEMPLQTQLHLAEEAGVWFERKFSLRKGRFIGQWPIQRKVLVEETSIMTVDMDEDWVTYNTSIEEGLCKYIRSLMELGISFKKIELLVNYSPARFLGI